MSGARSPGQRAGLTRADVIAGARNLITREGADALTMRELARRLDVAPNALYSHVDSKTALIDDVLDDVLADVDAPPPAARDPVAALHRMMTATLETLLAHPGLVPLYVARHGARGPHARRLGQAMIDLLGRAGVTAGAAREAQRVLVVYTIGFAAFSAEPPLETGGPVPATELVTSFDRGLAWLLAGIVAR